MTNGEDGEQGFIHTTIVPQYTLPDRMHIFQLGSALMHIP